jgi:hypothetical protein
MTIRTRPTADRTAPPVSKRRVGSAGRGSWIRRLNKMIVAMTSAWNTKAARQLMAEVMRPPSSGPAAAPMPPISLIAPNARARELTPVNHKVVRMYTGGISSAVPTPSKIELPRMRTPRPGAAALNRAPMPYRTRPTVKSRLRP